MKLIKIITLLSLIAKVCVANQGYNDTLDKAYSAVGFTYSSLSGDVEADGIGLSGNFLLGNQNLVTQVGLGYLTADEILGTDVSALDVEAYSLSLGLGYIFEFAENLHIIPTVGYQYVEYGVLGYEAATANNFAYGATARFLLLENTVLSASVNGLSGSTDSVIPEFNNVEFDATSYTLSIAHHFNDAFSASVGYGTSNNNAKVIGISLIANF